MNKRALLGSSVNKFQENRQLIESYFYFQKGRFDMKDNARFTNEVVIVTGASSGFGRATAKLLSKRGYRVFGTSRRELSNLDEEFEMLLLDVSSDDSVQACVEQVLNAAGRIDLLINNAGYALSSFVEETTLDEVRSIFETNFFGVVRMTKAVLPIMRKQRHGRIINISSLAGLVGVPSQGFYSASKFALEGYSEALKYEVEKFNIKVSLIEPSFFRTNLHKVMVRRKDEIADYDSFRNAVESSFENAIQNGGDPEKVAELIVRVARGVSQIEIPHWK
jgi:NAD(P)-dependent dehydrogenase (short-subunit alcohol dehydrogenase family)